MNKQEANKMAEQIGALFNTYFKNRYMIHCGKHWHAIAPKDPPALALETITTNCKAKAVTRQCYAFDITVEAKEPKFVDAGFHISLIEKELQIFYKGELESINDWVDLRHGVFSLVYKLKDLKQYYHFNFRLR